MTIAVEMLVLRHAQILMVISILYSKRLYRNFRYELLGRANRLYLCGKCVNSICRLKFFIGFGKEFCNCTMQRIEQRFSG